MVKTNLRGQNVIAGNAVSLNYDRIEHYKSFVDQNSAVGPNYTPSQLLDTFLEYRRNWIDQPKEWSVCNASNIPHQRRFRPLSLDIEVASICDLACPYCFRQTYVTPDKIMKLDLAKNLIDQAKSMNIPSIKLNWRGEPLLNPHLSEIISYAKSSGIADVIINTNATHLTEQKSIELIQSGLDYIIFSFDGGTKETYESNRVSRFKPNTFESVVANIRRFCELKKQLNSPFPYTRVQCVLTPEAFHEQELYADLFNEYVDEVVVNNYDERGQGSDTLSEVDKNIYNAKLSSYSLDANSHYIKQADGQILVSKKRLPCDQPHQRMLVTYDGRVSMCCFDWGSMYTIGYVRPEPFTDVNYDKYKVLNLAKSSAKSFELMPNVNLPPQHHIPDLVVKTLEEIWFGPDVSHVRKCHADGNLSSISMCDSCTYRGSHDWI